MAHRGDFPPAVREMQGAILAAGLLGGITARGDHDDFGGGSRNFLARNAERWSAASSEPIRCTGEFDHLRHPMPAYVERLQPLEEGDARPFRRAMDLLANTAESLADLLQKPLGFGAVASLFADPQDVAPDIAQVLGIQAKDLRAPIEARERRRQVAG